MAKNNMLLGYARGKVGDLVFQRRKGEQITKARNRNPNNPRTWAQQMQRVRMYAPVAFYKLAIENFFRFAFENKKPNETDYNAFVRENLNAFNGPYFTRGQVRKGYVPIAPYKVSNGSLGSPSFELNTQQGNNTINILFDIGAEELLTVADVSKTIISNGYQQGDLFTAVWIVAATSTLEPGNDEGQIDGVDFKYVQFVVDVNDTRVFADAYKDIWSIDVTENKSLGTLKLSANMGTGDVRTLSICYAAIVTRRSNSKIYASNTNLKLNETANEYFKAFSSTEQLINAAASYDATQSVLDPKAAKRSASTSVEIDETGRTIIKEAVSTEQSVFNCMPYAGQKITPGPVEQNAPHNCPNCSKEPIDEQQSCECQQNGRSRKSKTVTESE